MMAPPDRRLEKIPGTDQKVKLHNDLLTGIQGDRTLLSGRVGQNEGERIFKKVTDAVWYLDGRKETLNTTSRKRKCSELPETPKRFDKYSGYQKWKKSLGLMKKIVICMLLYLFLLSKTI